MSEIELELWVLYWVDLDCDCLKKSIIRILGVYDSKERAKAEIPYNSKGYCEDDRCWGAYIRKVKLNKDPSDEDETNSDNEYYIDEDDEAEKVWP